MFKGAAQDTQRMNDRATVDLDPPRARLKFVGLLEKPIAPRKLL